jgi:TatD DNase family protein
MKNDIPYVNIHSHSSGEDGVVCIKNISNGFNAPPSDELISIGIHPWYIQKETVEEELTLIANNATNKNVLAIGECGLDKLSEVDFELQKSVFVAHLKIAEQVKKPVIIHCVKAFDELIKIKKELNVTVPMIVHGYNNNGQIAEQLIKNSFYFSFGKALLNENSNATKVISKIPTDKLFLETDDGDISIKRIFEAVSLTKSCSEEELKKKVFSNFINLFKYV